MNLDDITIKAAQKGNMDAFRRIVESYQSIVFGICFNVLKDHHEAENAAQETFIKVYSSLNTYEFKGFKTWVSRIALNKSIDLKRRIQKSGSYSAVSLDENINFIIKDDKMLEDEIIRQEERKNIIDKCEELPEVYSTVINKYYQENKSYEQIAFEEGISIKTVESRLYRGRKKLRESLEEG